MDWIDLTQTISTAMPGVQIRQTKKLEEDGWNAQILDLYTHAGTHMDAPVHFGMPGPTIDRIPLDNLFGYARILDLTGIEPGAEIKVDDLGILQSQLKEWDSLIIKTGWSRFSLSHPEKYRDQLPRIGEELAYWLVKKRIKILAVEPPSVADVNNLPEVTLIHRILFSAQIIIVEGICNLDGIKGDEVELMVLPLKIMDGDGAPARVLVKPVDKKIRHDG
jgi:kynurenine formamidase